MPARCSAQQLPLPKGWSRIVTTAVLHALSLAATALTIPGAGPPRAALTGMGSTRHTTSVDRQ